MEVITGDHYNGRQRNTTFRFLHMYMHGVRLSSSPPGAILITPYQMDSLPCMPNPFLLFPPPAHTECYTWKWHTVANSKECNTSAITNVANDATMPITPYPH
eukprot:1159697-Pelagomonas_calceolata.AAC.11